MPLRMYLDASGDATLPAIGIGGFIAPLERWQSFSDAWSSVLKQYEVPELHMREFTAFRGPFKSWKSDEAKRRRFLKALTDVMHDHTYKSLTVTMFMRDYWQVNRVFKVREHLGTPYSFTMLTALVLARAWQQDHHPAEQMETFIEHGDSDQGELLGILKRIAFEHPVTRLRKKLTRPDGTAEYVFPFQACDYVAYECAKAGKTSEKLRAEEFMARKSMSLIAPKERDDYWRYIDAAGILAFVKTFRVPRRDAPMK